jgi:diacylglycerol kinase family enzyme
MKAAIEAEVGDRPDTVVAAGGDGTVNAVASKLIGTEIRFGILPLGTLNHFAKDIGVPLDVDAAIATVIDGHCIKADVGQVNQQVFVNNSSIGLYPDIVSQRDAEQRLRKRGKWPAFCQAFVGALFRYPFMVVRMNVDGQKLEQRTPCLFVGNNEYALEGFDIGGRKRVDAGVLSLCIVQSEKRMALLALAVRALFGRLQQSRDLKTMLATEIMVETTHRRKRVATDGQVNVMDIPLHYRIHPGALNVIVPRPASVAAKE